MWYKFEMFYICLIIISDISKNKSTKYSFSKFRSERSKAKSVKSTFLEKQQHARIENLSLWCARDSGKRKYYRKRCRGRVGSRHNIAQVKDAIIHQDLLNPEMRLYSPWGKQQDWARHFVPFHFEDRGGGKGLGWISKGFRCHLSIRRDCTGGTATIKDLHNSNREEEWRVREKTRLRKKKRGRDRQRQARNKSSHACLPKRTTLSALKGEGRACMVRRQASGCWSCSFFSLLLLPQLAVQEGFSLISKEESTQCTVCYVSHLPTLLLYNTSYNVHWKKKNQHFMSRKCPHLETLKLSHYIKKHLR